MAGDENRTHMNLLHVRPFKGAMVFLVIAREQNPLLIWPIKKTKKVSGFLIRAAPNTLLIYPTFLLTRKPPTLRLLLLSPMGIPSQLKGKGDYILLGGTKVNEVLYVPDFKCNLLSVSHHSRDLQCCISFFRDFCVMQGLQRNNLIGAGRCEGGLYRMNMVQGRRVMATIVKTWHKRLEHASKEKLETNKDSVEEPITCHDCDCHDEPILAQNKEQNLMEQDQQMDHDQTNKLSGSHETHDGDETGQINDEGQPNNDEIESNDEEEAQAETRPTRTKTQPSRFKDFAVQVPPSVKHSTSTSNQVTFKCFKQAAQDARWCKAIQKEVKALEKNGNNLTKIQETKKQLDDEFNIKDLGPLKMSLHETVTYRLSSLASELHVHNPLATPLFCDNQAARHIANKPVFDERTNHVEMDCDFVRERVESKEIIPMKISSKMQIAEKDFQHIKFNFFLARLALQICMLHLEGE
nr:hypothetical protein [Tanacetum cinerariifolium]